MKTLKYIVSALVLLAVASCQTFEEFNESPNQVPVGGIGPADLMDELLCNGALNCQQRFYDTFAELMQYTVVSSSSNEVVHRYSIAPSYINNVWDNFAKWYVNADHMYDLAVEAGDENYQAVAITLRTMWVEMLTAAFGYIPYFEANAIRDGNNKPKFDAPKDIYAQLILDLEEANKLYNTKANLSVPSKDKMYHGDTKKWQKFTNSLMLRILMRLSNRDNDMVIYWGESVAQKIKKIISNPSQFPVMESYQDNATIYYSGESPFQNNWGGYTESTLSGHRGSAYLISELNSKSDPRKWLWFQPWSASIQWMGVESGMPGDDTQSAGYPVMNFDLFINYTLPVSFMNHDEVCFIIAEAYCRTNETFVQIPGSPSLIKEWYDKGVRSSCEFWRYIYCDYLGKTGRIAEKSVNYRSFTCLEPAINANGDEMVPVIDDAAIELYIESGAPFDPTVANGLKSIIDQKFVSNFRICMEGYNDYRRTGYPQLAIGIGTINNATLPYRLEYPVTTKTTNPDNYNDCLAELAATYYDGGDNMLTPVWWSEAALAKEIR